MAGPDGSGEEGGHHRGDGAAPDQIVNALRRDVPAWIIGAVLALLGLLAYLGLEWHADRTVDETLAPFAKVVQLAPRPPTLTLTLP